MSERFQFIVNFNCNKFAARPETFERHIAEYPVRFRSQDIIGFDHQRNQLKNFPWERPEPYLDLQTWECLSVKIFKNGSAGVENSSIYCSSFLFIVSCFLFRVCPIPPKGGLYSAIIEMNREGTELAPFRGDGGYNFKFICKLMLKFWRFKNIIRRLYQFRSCYSIDFIA